MSECPSCSARVRPGQSECENCGFPLGSSSPRTGRETRIDGAPSPPRGLYRPSGRKTQIDSAEPFVPSSAPARAAVVSRSDDPFARSLTGAEPSRSKRRRTVIGAAASADGGMDPFAAALTAPAAPFPALDRPLAGVLITFSGAPNGVVMPLTMGRTVLGRDPGPSGPDVLLIDDDSISARHCILVAREAGVMLKDEMSSNGTMLRSGSESGFRDILAETVMLSDGDQIKLGETILLLRLLDRSVIDRVWARA